MNREQEHELIKKVLSGDKESFHPLMNASLDAVYRLCLSILKNEVDASDACSETFIIAYKSLAGFRREAAFSSWIYRIAYRYCIRLSARNSKNRRTHISIEEGALEGIHTGENDEGFFEHRRKLLILSLERLDSQSKAMIRLHYFEQVSINELAKIFSMSVSNIKVKLFRARKKLAIFINEMEKCSL